MSRTGEDVTLLRPGTVAEALRTLHRLGKLDHPWAPGMLLTCCGEVYRLVHVDGSAVRYRSDGSVLGNMLWKVPSPWIVDPKHYGARGDRKKGGEDIGWSFNDPGTVAGLLFCLRRVLQDPRVFTHPWVDSDQWDVFSGKYQNDDDKALITLQPSEGEGIVEVLMTAARVAPAMKVAGLTP